MSDKIQFIADDFKVKLNKTVDHSSEVSFLVGEYLAQEISKLSKFIGKNIKVTVEEE